MTRSVSVRLRAPCSYRTTRPLVQLLPLRFGPSHHLTPFSTSPPNSSQWDVSKPYVSFRPPSDSSFQLHYKNIKHTPKANLNRLIPALNDLLNMTAFTPWKLSEDGDALLIEEHHFSSKWQAEEIAAGIKKIGDEMNHHADIEILHIDGETPPDKDFSGLRDDACPWFLKIRCTTHQPAGLGMRDVELARKIGGILDSLSTPQKEPLEFMYA